MLKAVFLDIDNTLLDFDAYVKMSMQTGFSRFGLRPYEPWMYDVFTENNLALWRRIERGELDFDGLKQIRWNMIFEKLNISFDGVAFEEYFRKYLNESAIPEEGVMEMFNAISELKERYGFFVCAASNGPYDQQVKRLKIAGMDRYMDHVFVSEKLGVSKPFAGFYERAFEEIAKGLPVPNPADCLMVGDSLTSDVAGGKNFGMKTCLYHKNGESEEKIDAVRPDYVIEKMTDLVDVVRDLL